MAEDEYQDVTNEEDLKIEEGRPSSQRPTRVYGGYLNRQCNARLEELAKPKKWLMLATWREHRYIFDPERMQMLKERIQEEFSMTPEETEIYFNQLRRRAKRILNKKALAKQIRREKALAKEEAYQMFRKILRKGMKYAFSNPPPPIVSPVVRETSDKVLTVVSDWHGACVPKRDNTDKLSVFLIYLSDWAAILISNIYYELNVREKIEAERLEQSSKSSVGSSEKEGEMEKCEEGGMSTTEGETESEMGDETEKGESEASLSEPESKAKLETEDDTGAEDAYQIPE